MDKFLEIVADLLEVDGPLKPEMVYKEFENWDSLTIVSLLAQINLTFNKTLRMADFKDTKTLGDIYAIIEAAPEDKA